MILKKTKEKNTFLTEDQLEDKARSQNRVLTRSLRNSVSESLELLINEVLYYHRHIKQCETLSALEKTLSPDEIAKVLADEGLIFVFRQMFTLFCEGREKIANSNLLDSKKTPILNEAIICDEIVQKIISKLSISEMGKGKNKKMGRISYANLGLNQLGAVYEGLLSLKPVITDNEYYTAILGTQNDEFLIPKSDVKKFEKNQIKSDEEGKPIVHQKGEFLFRTMGYERKYSASFYTDETLTKCLVKECLEEHFKVDNGQPTCKKIEEMKILEPAMGSGAFLNETANQLAVFYADALVRENRNLKTIEVLENGKKIVKNIEKDRVELISEAKEFIMRNCLYGVDLNPMATELAKVSLWLNCVSKNGSFAFHDFKIRRGNSLVGAFIRQKAHFSNDIHHFLVPLPQMVDTYIEAVELGDKRRPFFNDKQILKLKEIKRDYVHSSEHHEKLKLISKAVNDLYKKHTDKRTEFQKNVMSEKYSTSEIENLYYDYLKENHEYKKLRTMMDYWCSLWFWKPEEIDSLPNMKEYLSDLENIIEKNELSFKRSKMLTKIIASVPFFHFDLEYPEVFNKGGFDLVLGNPPWAQLSWSDMDFFSDNDHSYLVNEFEKGDEKKLFEKDLKNEAIQNKYKEGLILVEGIRNFLSESLTYPFKDHSKTNTYKFFWQRSRSLTKSNGTYGLIKQGGILSDKGTESLRPIYYKELTKIYRFINEKKLFEVHNNVEFVVAVFNKFKGEVNFNLIDNLYHPITIERCKKASFTDEYPGNKNDEGNFDLNGHPDRIVSITENTLRELTLLEGKKIEEYLNVSLPGIHGLPEWKLIQKAINAKEHLGDKDFYWTQMFNETNALKDGLIETWTKSHKDISQAVLTGPNIDVGNPFYKEPNLGCKNNRDYSEIDLNEISEDFFPATKYRVTKKGESSGDYNSINNDKFRIFSRGQVSTTGSRTLSSAIYPPKVSHVHGLCSLILENDSMTVYLQGLFSSIIYDFYSRSFSTGTLSKNFWSKLPIIYNEKIFNELNLRTLRLNCLSSHYKDLWKNCFNSEMKNSPSLPDYSPSTSNSKLTSNWSYNSPLRDENEREQALCEIDALVAMLMGVSSDELVKLYRSQFGALQKKLKDLPGQNEEDSFPRARLMKDAYQMFLKHFHVTEKDVVEGYFQNNNKQE